MRAIEAAVEVLKREGIDMITGLYSASADSIPILCITGQAPRARLHKQDFQAVDIASITQPVTKWATTVLEPAQVPRVFQKAFHIMRSGRPAGENGVTENG
jgi:tartronate-semialdehyde synthase